MFSLNLRVFSSFNAGARGGFGSADLEATGTRRQCAMRATGRIVRCSSGSCWEGRDSNYFLSRRQAYILYKQQLMVAMKFEDYEAAAKLRDLVRFIEDEEPVPRLRRLINEAVADERYQDASRYKAELMEIAPHSFLKCSSDLSTMSIRVQAWSGYIEDRSRPSEKRFFFAYKIRITNYSNHPVQLLRRHWIIIDGNGKIENAWGIGVIGAQPVIPPNTGFQYVSACPLSTDHGRMSGEFEMRSMEGPSSETFIVRIAPFCLSVIGDACDLL